MKPIRKIMSIGDLLDEMETSYYSRPLYEMFNMCKDIYNYLFNKLL